MKLPKIKIKKINIKKINRPDFRSFSKKTFSGRSLIVIVGAVFVLITLISQRFYLRLDLTDQRVYSLSHATKDIIQSLENEVTIEVYISDNLPPDLASVRQNSIDLFKEFDKNSKGKVKVEVIDPSGASFNSKATANGVQQIQFSELSDDSFSVAQGFLGAVVVVDNDTFAIPVITNSGNLEYEVTSRIVRATTEQEKKIAFLIGHGEKSIITELTEVNELLQAQYQTENLDLSNGKPINSDEYATLIIASPTDKISEREIFEIEQFVLKGGSLLILSDLLKLEEQSPIVTKTDSNINEILNIFGMEQESKILLDESFTPIVSGINKIAYPYWVLLTKSGFNSEIPPLSSLNSATFLWSNPLVRKEEKDLKITEILTSTESGWTETGETISIDFKEFLPTDQRKQIIGLLAEGSLESSFKDKKIPELKNKDMDDARKKDEKKLEQSENIRVAAIGDVDFITDSFHNANEQNLPLFLNLVEWLSDDEGLSEIRAKSIAPRPLEESSEENKNVLKILNLSLSTVIIVFIGAVYLRKRKTASSKI